MEINSMDEQRKPHSLFFPLLLVTAGVFFLLANLGFIQNTAWGIVATYWPLIFVIGGLDSLYRHEGWVGPLVGIGLGTVLLLGNLHYLQWGSLELLLRLWPILLVAWGLDIAFGREKTVWSTAVRVTLGVLLVAGILWLSIASPFGNGLKTEVFDQPLDGATQSSLSFSMAAGEMTISGGANNDTLVNGTISLPKEASLSPDYQKPTDGESSLSLSGAGIVVIPFGSSAPWNMKINSVIPLDVTNRMAVGNMAVDLSDIKMKNIDSEMAVGRTVLTVPETSSTGGEVKLAVGELVIRVPRGTHVILHTQLGAVTKQLPEGYTSSEDTIESAAKGDNVVELRVDIAVGSLVVQEIP
jgi:hypothetical protein